MNGVDAKQLFKRCLSIWEAGENDQLGEVYHPDFIGGFHTQHFDLAQLANRFKQLHKNYQKVRNTLVDTTLISENQLLVLWQLNALQAGTNLPCEATVSSVLTLKEGRIYRANMLSTNFMDMTAGSDEEISEDLTVESTLRHKFEQRLEMISQHLGIDMLLSERESECLYFYITAYSAKEIGVKLDISQRTVEKHLSNVKAKLHLSTKGQLKKLFKLS